MKILHIDMDGVVANFDKRVRELVPDLETKGGPDWEARSRRVTALAMANPMLFQEMDLIEGAFENVSFLSRYFDIYFLSTPVWAAPESYRGKRIWLEDKFGALAHKKLILTHRKDLIIGDYLVDDNTYNGAGEFQGKHIHFGTKEFPDWVTIRHYLKSKV